MNLPNSALREEQTGKNQSSNVGNSILRSFENTIHFRFNKNLIKSSPKCVPAAEFQLNELPWRISVCSKAYTEGENEEPKIDYVEVELEAIFTENTTTWSCEAESQFKLIANNGTAKGGKIKNSKFSKSDSKQTFQKFLLWKEFVKNYVKDDFATFDFNTRTKSLDRSPLVEQTTAKFHVRLKQVGKFGYQYSNELVLRGIRWQIFALKGADHLQIGALANENDFNTEIKWNVTAYVSLISKNSEKTKQLKFKDIEFSWARTSYGFPKVLAWDEFVKAENGYVQSNAALLEIELIVNPIEKP